MFTLIVKNFSKICVQLIFKKYFFRSSSSKEICDFSVISAHTDQVYSHVENISYQARSQENQAGLWATITRLPLCFELNGSPCILPKYCTETNPAVCRACRISLCLRG